MATYYTRYQWVGTAGYGDAATWTVNFKYTTTGGTTNIELAREEPFRIDWGRPGEDVDQVLVEAIARVNVQLEGTYTGSDIGDDIINSVEKSWALEILKNGSQVFFGIIEQDIGARQLGPNAVVTFKATSGLESLQHITYPYTSDGRSRSLLSVIDVCLDQLPYVLPYKTSNNLYPAGTSTGDPLTQIFPNQTEFQDVDANAYTCKYVLEQCLERLKLQIRQADGYWWIIQPEYWSSGTVNVYTYNSSVALQSTDNAYDPTFTYDPSSTPAANIVGNIAQHRVRPAYGRMSTVYLHGKAGKDFIVNGQFDPETEGQLDWPSEWTRSPDLATTALIARGNSYPIDPEWDKTDTFAWIQPYHAEYNQWDRFRPDTHGTGEIPTTHYIEQTTSKQIQLNATFKFRFALSLFGQDASAYDDADNDVEDDDLDYGPRYVPWIFQVGSYYWNHGNRTWEASTYVNYTSVDPNDIWVPIVCELRGAEGNGSKYLTAPDTGTVSFRVYAAIDDICYPTSTAEGGTPDNYENDDWITACVGGGVDGVSLLFEDDAGSEPTSLKTVLTLTGGDLADRTLDERTFMFGDGPSEYHDRRLTITGGDPTELWQRNNAGTEYSLDEWWLKATAAQMRKAREVLVAKFLYVSDMMSAYDVLEWPTGERRLPTHFWINPYHGYFGGEFVRLKEDGETGSSTSEVEQREAATNVYGAGQARSSIFFNTWAGNTLTARRLTETTDSLDRSTGYTSIPIEAINEDVLVEGDECLLIDPDTGEGYVLTLTATQTGSDTTLSVTTFTPTRKKIRKAAPIYQYDKNTLATLTLVDGAFRVMIEGGYIGLVDGAQSGTLTTINVDPWLYPLSDNTEIRIYHADDSYTDCTLNGDTNKGDTSITIDSQAVTLGDNDEIYAKGMTTFSQLELLADQIRLRVTTAEMYALLNQEDGGNLGTFIGLTLNNETLGTNPVTVELAQLTDTYYGVADVPAGARVRVSQWIDDDADEGTTDSPTPRVRDSYWGTVSTAFDASADNHIHITFDDLTGTVPQTYMIHWMDTADNTEGPLAQLKQAGIDIDANQVAISVFQDDFGSAPIATVTGAAETYDDVSITISALKTELFYDAADDFLTSYVLLYDTSTDQRAIAKVGAAHDRGDTTLTLHSYVSTGYGTANWTQNQTYVYPAIAHAMGRIRTLSDEITLQVFSDSRYLLGSAASTGHSATNLRLKTLGKDLYVGDKILVYWSGDSTNAPAIEELTVNADVATDLVGPVNITVVSFSTNINEDDPCYPGELTQMRLTLSGISVHAKAFHTDGWKTGGGTWDASGNITAFSSAAGWALTNAGHFEFTDGTNFFRFNASGFELQGILKLTSGSEIQGSTTFNGGEINIGSGEVIIDADGITIDGYGSGGGETPPNVNALQFTQGVSVAYDLYSYDPGGQGVGDEFYQNTLRVQLGHLLIENVSTGTGSLDGRIIIDASEILQLDGTDGIYMMQWLDLSNTSTPGTTTNRLYASSGNLYWNGIQLDTPGTTTLAGLTDTDITTPGAGSLLVYDGTNSWDDLDLGTTGYFLLSNGSTVVWTNTMTAGLTIDANSSNLLVLDQAANDNQIIEFRSSDVAHNLTSVFGQTDTYFNAGKGSAGAGGFLMRGIQEGTGSDTGVEIEAYFGDGDPNQTTTANGGIEFGIVRHDQAGTIIDFQNLDENIATFKYYNATGAAWVNVAVLAIDTFWINTTITGATWNGNTIDDGYLTNDYQPLDADLTAIAALAKTDGNFIVGNGSTWVAEDPATARTSLGLGTMATQTESDYGALASNENVTGQWTFGTSGSGQGIKINAPTSGVTTLVAADATVTITLPGTTGTLALTSHTHSGVYQPLDATLTALAGVTTSADKFIYATASDTFTTATVTSFARTILDDVDAGTVRGTLGLGTMATATESNYGALASNENVTGQWTFGTSGSGQGIKINAPTSGVTTLVAADATVTITLPGTTGTLALAGSYQPLDSDLTAIAALSSADGNFIVGSAGGWVAESGSTARSSLGLGDLAVENTVSLAGQVTDTLPIANGGTGAITASAARSNLGLGTMATQTESDYGALASNENVTGQWTFGTSGSGQGIKINAPTAGVTTLVAADATVTITLPSTTGTLVLTGHSHAAGDITSGTLSSDRISGSYTGITGVGTLTAGTWTANVIASAYLDSDTMHLSVAQTVTGSKFFTDDLGVPAAVGATAGASTYFNMWFVPGEGTYGRLKFKDSSGNTYWVDMTANDVP